MSVWSTAMSQPSVNRLVWILAETKYEGDFFRAKHMLALEWENLAWEARHAGNASWEMWDALGLKALAAERP